MKKTAILFLVLSFLVASCSKSEKTPPPGSDGDTITLILLPSTVPEFAAAGGNIQVEVQTNASSWDVTVEPGKTWCRTSALAGNRLKITVDPNLSHLANTAVVTVRAGGTEQPLTIRQAGVDYSSEDAANTGPEYTYDQPALPASLWTGYADTPSKSADINKGDILKTVDPRGQWREKTGYYTIWYGNKEYFMNLPLVNGGQMNLQWSEFEPVKGTYEFSKLEKMMRAYSERRIYATLQINGGTHPGWMFDEIPYVAGEQLDVQVSDTQGTLMYWYPTYVEYYKGVLAAVGNFIRTSPYKDAICGLRFNFNGIGTEKLDPPASHQKADGTVINTRKKDVYHYPSGSNPDLASDWNATLKKNYEQAVFAQHITSFSFLNILVRNGLEDETFNANRGSFESGALSWFHTSSEPEPRGAAGEKKALKFNDFCRNGKTVGYAEEWADCWGFHGGKTDPHFCSPVQWNYWRILCDLNVGISYMGMYGSIWEVAMGGTPPQVVNGKPTGLTITEPERKEIQRGIEFGYKYLGYHDKPEKAPGAFVALRYSTENLSIKEGLLVFPTPDGYSTNGVSLSSIIEDYTYLAVRQRDNSTGLKEIGPDNQRFGAFARRLPQGGQMKIVLNPKFAKAVYGKPLRLRVVYYNEGNTTWKVSYGGQDYTVNNTGTNRWLTAEWDVTGAPRINPLTASPVIDGGMVANVNKMQIEALNPDIVLTAVSGNPVFHLVEIDRSMLFPEMYQ